VAFLFAIEGIDGAGKGTLARNLLACAEAAGVRAAALSFPRYNETRFARLIADYLNGRFGRLEEVPVRFAVLLYAGDRMETLPRLNGLLAAHELVVLDRYVASNAAYNAAKLAPAERPAFVEWIWEVEHDVFGLPPPDLTCLLATPPATAHALVGRKGARDYTAARRDLHESADGYMAEVARLYRDLAAAEARSPWLVVDPTDGVGGLRPPAALAEEVWRHLAPRL